MRRRRNNKRRSPSLNLSLSLSLFLLLSFPVFNCSPLGSAAGHRPRFFNLFLLFLPRSLPVRGISEFDRGSVSSSDSLHGAARMDGRVHAYIPPCNITDYDAYAIRNANGGARAGPYERNYTATRTNFISYRRAGTCDIYFVRVACILPPNFTTPSLGRKTRLSLRLYYPRSLRLNLSLLGYATAFRS